MKLRFGFTPSLGALIEIQENSHAQQGQEAHEHKKITDFCHLCCLRSFNRLVYHNGLSYTIN